MNKAKGVAKIQEEIRLPRDMYVSCESCCVIEDSVDYEDETVAAQDFALFLWDEGWRVNELTGFLMCSTCGKIADEKEKQHDQD